MCYDSTFPSLVVQVFPKITIITLMLVEIPTREKDRKYSIWLIHHYTGCWWLLALTLFVSWVSIMKLCTCFSARVNSSFRDTTATRSAVQPAPCISGFWVGGDDAKGRRRRTQQTMMSDVGYNPRKSGLEDVPGGCQHSHSWWPQCHGSARAVVAFLGCEKKRKNDSRLHE